MRPRGCAPSACWTWRCPRPAPWADPPGRTRRTPPSRWNPCRRISRSSRSSSASAAAGWAWCTRRASPSLDRIVALKVLAPKVKDDPAFAERFQREARALARLTHPNIVTLHDFGESNGRWYFLMEYVDGISVREALEGARMLARGGARHRAGGVRRAAVRARPRHRPPRHQAGEPAARPRRPCEDRGLRLGEDRGAGPEGAHADRHAGCVGNAPVHGARAVRAPAARRPPRRHLCAGRGVLRDADRRAADGALRAALAQGARGCAAGRGGASHAGARSRSGATSRPARSRRMWRALRRARVRARRPGPHRLRRLRRRYAQCAVTRIRDRPARRWPSGMAAVGRSEAEP